MGSELAVIKLMPMPGLQFWTIDFATKVLLSQLFVRSKAAIITVTLLIIEPIRRNESMGIDFDCSIIIKLATVITAIELLGFCFSLN